MGNKPYALPKRTYNNFNCFKNRFGLTPYETSMLNFTFTQYTGRERRMYYNQFKKCYKRLNSDLSAYEIGIAAPIAFTAADTNCDGTLSFDEFLDSYVCFKATPCFRRFQNSGLILY